MPTVAESIVEALAELGVRTVWGVVGDALNPVTDAIRREDRVEWIGTRHEEVAAFAAGAQAQLTGTLGVCMGTVGPGSIHLLNGLYDAKKSHAPVLALCGQVPLAEVGSDFFQEVDNDALFNDVAVFCETVTSPAQMPWLLERAVQGALQERGVAVLTLPGDVGATDVPKDTPAARFVSAQRPVVPDPAAVRAAAELLDGRARHAAGRARRTRGAGRRARPRRPPRRADGADPEGQGAARARQPVRPGPDRADRQPGRAPRARRRRRAADARHRLPLPRLVSKG